MNKSILNFDMPYMSGKKQSIYLMTFFKSTLIVCLVDITQEFLSTNIQRTCPSYSFYWSFKVYDFKVRCQRVKNDDVKRECTENVYGLMDTWKTAWTSICKWKLFKQGVYVYALINVF